jgi:hypothetical protein
MDNKPIKEFAIPMLPSNSIKDTLEFYQALGFVVIYQQKLPNTYICLKIRGIEIHFFALKQLKPANNYSSCYLVVDKIDDLYNSFSMGLKNKLGKVPTKGVPRINPLKDMASYGVRQFVVIDPSGNYVRIGQPISKTDSLIYSENGKKPVKGTPLAKAYELGSRLANGKDDLKAAVEVLDKAILSADTSDIINLFRIISLRVDVAKREDDIEKIKTLSVQGKDLLKKITDISAISDDLATFNLIMSEQH